MPPANDENAGAEPLVTASSAPAVPPSPPPVDEGPSPFVQEGVPRKHLHAASVTFLDGTKHVFYVHRNAEADILYTLVTDFLQLNEKDYFGLAFYDEQTIRQWLYKDKKIVKTLKGRPWEFTFEVKFYPPEPSQLADDLTKYLLHLQLRNDIVTEKLPATFATHALLGSYIAQSEFGDYVPNLDGYDAFLRNARIAPIVTSDLNEKVRELHRQNKGQTAQEAELNYLNTCKKLSMYGVTLFPAKDNKGKSVHIGVSAHGVSVYNDQIRIHRFVWQSIIKIAYRRNVFSIRLKAGEIEKKEATVSYKLADYPSAKRLWKCAVEHHTFFRLMQPEDKPKKHLLRWGSARFRYLGRTHFQTTMASQMFDSATASERPQSARAVSRSADDIAAKVHKEPTSPLHYVDENSKELVSSPEKTYDLSSSGSPKKKKSKQKQLPVAAADEYYVATPTTSHGGNTSSLLASSSPSDVATTSDGASPSSVYSPRAVDVVSPVTHESSSSAARNGRTSTSSGSQRVRFRDQTAHAASRARRNLFGRLGRKESNSPYLAPLPIIRNGQHKRPTSAQGVVYHNGSLHDTDDTREQRRKRHKRLSDWLGVTKRYPTPVSALLAEDQKLALSDEIETYPIRYYSAIYHSGQSTPYSSVFESAAESDVDDGAPDLAANYAFAKTEIFEHGRMEKATELDTEPLLIHCKRTLVGGQLQTGSKRKRWDSEDNLSQPGSKRVAVLYLKQRLEESDEKATHPLSEGYPALTDAYVGPVSELRPDEEIDEETLPTSQSRRADEAMEAIEAERATRATKVVKTRILRFTSKTTFSEDAANLPEKLHGYPSLSEPYRGTYLIETLAEQISEAPLRSVVSVYHSGFITRHYKVITEIHVGHEERDTEPSVSYAIGSTPHEGPVEALEPVEELRASSIREHCLATRVPQVESESSDESTRRTADKELLKHTAKLTLRSPRKEEAQPAAHESEAIERPMAHIRPVKAEKKRATLWTSKEPAISKESDSDALHEPNLAAYRKDSIPYDGELERLVAANELETVPLKYHVSIYHQGLSVEKPKGYQKVLATLHIRRSSAGRDFLPSFKNVGEKSPKISPAGKEFRKASRRSTSSPKTSVSAAESQNIRQLKRISNFEKKAYITAKTESAAQEQALSAREDQKKSEAIGSQTSTSYSHVEIHRRAIKNFITHEAKPMVTASEVQRSEEPLMTGPEESHPPSEGDRIRQTAVLHIKSEQREETAEEASPVELTEKHQLPVSVKEEAVSEAATGVAETNPGVPTPSPSRPDTYLRILRISTKSPSPTAETRQVSPLAESAPAYLVSHWPQKTEPFSGYVDSIDRMDELHQEPLRSHVQVYHSGRPTITVYRTYTYKAAETSLSEEKVVTHPPSAVYEGGMDALSYKPGLPTEPLKQYVPHYRRASTKRWTQRIRRPILETRRAVERRAVSRRAPRRLSRQANLEVHVKDSGPPSKRKSKAIIYLRVQDEPEASTDELGQKEEVPVSMPQEALKQELIDSHESPGPVLVKPEGTKQRIATFLRVKRKPVESKKADIRTERTDESAQLSKKTAIIHVKSEPVEPEIETLRAEAPAEAQDSAEITKTTAVLHVKAETPPEAAETTDQFEVTASEQAGNVEAVEVQQLKIAQELVEAPLERVAVKQEITEEPEQRETPVRTAVIQVKSPPEMREQVYDAQIEMKHELIDEEYRQETTTTKLTLTEVKSAESTPEPDVEQSSTSKITAVVHAQKKGKKRKGKSKGKQAAAEKHPVEPAPSPVTTEILARTAEVEAEPLLPVVSDDIGPEASAVSDDQWEVPGTVNDAAQPLIEWSATPDWDSQREEGSPKKTVILHLRNREASPLAEEPASKPKATKPAPKQRCPFDAEPYAGPLENIARVPEVESVRNALMSLRSGMPHLNGLLQHKKCAKKELNRLPDY
ncbi:FRM-1 protein [Aphelenchoides avenae]|nr:FRM-1 protein [Aphelenchus avenae]